MSSSKHNSFILVIIFCTGHFVVISSVSNNYKTAAVERASKCKIGWQEFNGHCYLFSYDQMSWRSAENFCESHNSILVRIETWEENQWLFEQMREQSAWTGGVRSYYGDFVWYNDLSDMRFTNFNPDEPNNAWGIEDCLLITVFNHGAWNDMECILSFSFVCETQL